MTNVIATVIIQRLSNCNIQICHFRKVSNFFTDYVFWLSLIYINNSSSTVSFNINKHNALRTALEIAVFWRSEACVMNPQKHSHEG